MKTVLSVLTLGALLLAFSCDPPTGQKQGGVSVRPLPADFSTRKAASYSGYRTSSSSTAPSSSQIDQDLDLLDRAGFKLLRLFSSSDDFAKVTLQRIAALELDMKVQLGVWIEGTGIEGYEDKNQAEIARGVALAQEFPQIVAAVSVGNEKMVGWQTVPNQVAPAKMKDYILSVRGQVTQPVTTDDNWAVFANDAGAYAVDPVIGALDYVSIHTYPLSDSLYADMDNPEAGNAYWDWLQLGVPEEERAEKMLEAAIGKAKKDYQAVKTYLAQKGFGNRPIVVGETGWKSEPSGNEEYRAHPINQKLYLDHLAAWTEPEAIFYFEAFDEPWKAGDDKWGLWNVNRKAKYALYDFFPLSGDRAATIGEAVYYIAPPTRVAVTANTYALYLDTVPGGAAEPSGNLTPLKQWIGWDSPWTASGTEVAAEDADTAAEGSNYLRVTPAPKAWGWGLFLYIQNLEDLSNFETSGHLHFSVRTTYPGKIEAGFFTKKTGSTGTTDVYLPIGSGDYGYSNDGSWHNVSIPVTVLKAAAATPANFDLTKVAHGFTIADRYAKTGKADGAGVTTPIDIDNIYWTRD